MRTWLFLSVLALAVRAASPAEALAFDPRLVYSCDFEPAADVNFDRWPDGWRRRHGRGFPLHVDIGLHQDSDPGPSGNGCLRIRLNGGAGIAYSPPVRIDPRRRYRLEGYLKTDGLRRNEAFYSVTYFSANDRELGSSTSRKFRRTEGWTKIEVTPASPEWPRAAYVVIGLHLQPAESGKDDVRPVSDFDDLRAVALFDDVRWFRDARLEISVDKPFPVFDLDEPILVRCEFDGVRGEKPMLRATLRDALGNTVLDEVHVIGTSSSDTRTPSRDSGPLTIELDDSTSDLADASDLADSSDLADASDLADSSDLADTSDIDGCIGGTVLWRPPVRQPGYYQVEITIVGSSGQSMRGSVPVVRARLPAVPARGDFGWRLSAPIRMSPSEIETVLPLVGIDWVEWPREDDELSPELVGLTDRLLRFGIRAIDPSDSTRLDRTVRSLEPPPRELDMATRARELVIRMVEAKASGETPIMLLDPLDPQHDFVTENRTPGRLLAAWLTAVQSISGARHVGRLELPAGSVSHVLARDESRVMVLWNERPVTERIALERRPRIVDAWGRRLEPLGLADGAYEIPVDTTPVFLTDAELNHRPTQASCGGGLQAAGVSTLHLPSRQSYIGAFKRPDDGANLGRSDMNAKDVSELVQDHIAGRWEESNLHGVDLRSALVNPTRTPMIQAGSGKNEDSIVEVWTVLRESSNDKGYVIFYDDDRNQFGLAISGLTADGPSVVCGYYGDFWTTFKAM